MTDETLLRERDALLLENARLTEECKTVGQQARKLQLAVELIQTVLKETLGPG